MAINFDFQRGEFVLTAAEKKEIEALMHQVGQSGNVEEMRVLGAELVAPIQTVADYVEWGNKLLTPLTIGATEDPRIPKERYDVQAFYTSPDGQVFITRAGYNWAHFEYAMVDVAFEIHWDDLAYAPFDLLAQKIKRAGEELARKRDAARKALIEAAVAGLSGHEPTHATTLDKDSIDAVLKAAAKTGFPIRRVVVNSGTILDMRSFSWPFTMPEAEARRLITTGYLGEYGEAEWISAHTVPSNKVYFMIDPANVGYTLQKGELRSAQDVNILRKTNVYAYDERRGNYIGNPYGIYVLTIT